MKANTQQEKFSAKVESIRRLYKKGFSKSDVKNLYSFLDWIIKLPQELEIKYHQQIQTIEEEYHVKYITTAERIGMAKGIEKGIEKGMEKGIEKGIQKGESTILQRLLLRKFGFLSPEYSQKIKQAEEKTLLSWTDRLFDASTLEEVFS